MRSRSSSSPAAVLSIGYYLNIFLHFFICRSDRGGIQGGQGDLRALLLPSQWAVIEISSYIFFIAGRIEAAYSEVKELFEPCCCPLNWLLFKYLLTFFYLQVG